MLPESLAKRGSHDINNYFYMPSLAGACISCVLFAAISITLSVLLRRHRVKYPMILPIGAGCEAIGYMFRALSASGHRETNFALFLLMDMFVILSPLAFMAGLYVIYGRLVRRLTILPNDANHEKNPSVGAGQADGCASGAAQPRDHKGNSSGSGNVSPLPGHWYARTFVTCDITSFLIQAAGAGLIVSSDEATANTGKSILMAGLGFGFATFAGFIALVLYANIVVSRAVRRGTFQGRGLTSHWRVGLMTPLTVSALCIVARTIYRIIEFAGGYSGHIYTTEWYLYVFDTTLMVICITIWIPFFPAKYGLDQSLAGTAHVTAEWQSSTDSSSNGTRHSILESSPKYAGNPTLETINVIS